MTENPADIDHSPLVFDDRNQPAAVVAYVENHEAPDNIAVPPAIADVRKVFPVRVPGDLVPSIQGRAPFAVFGGRLPEGFAADDPHRNIFAFCEVGVKMPRPI